MWINRKTYEELNRKHNHLIELCSGQKEEINKLKDDSGEAMLMRLKSLAVNCGLKVHDEEYQTFMTRMFMDIAGRESNAAKAYANAAFLKDNPEELIERMKALIKSKSIITKELEHDRKGK